MNSGSKPTGTRSRGLILTEQALELLDQALRLWWEESAARQASATGKLSREMKADGLGLTVNTVDRLYRREPVDEGTLRHAFNALKITPPFSKDRHCISPLPPCGNLPDAPTSCIGRETEIAEIKALLKANRLVTLTGTGGIGKTRLAVQVAATMQGDFAAGIRFVDLTGLTEVADQSRVTQTVAIALGVKEEKQRSLIETLADFLRTKPLLLILDNCEHLLEPCATLANDFLSSSSSLKVLATSREPLPIPAGHSSYSYRVPSLSIPNIKQASWEEDSETLLRDYASVRLFVERARLKLPNFTVTAQNASLIASICHRLDGLPLALELAAGRMGTMTLEALEHGLNDCFHLISGENRATLPRHQTLHATMDWSYNLLEEKEQALLRRLAVFADGWQQEAAKQVCAGNRIAEEEVLSLLDSLEQKSLVVSEGTDEETKRYRLLETIRQYAGGKLWQRGENNALQGHHRDYFLALAEAAASHLTGAEQEEWLERLEAEHANLNAALDRSLSEAGQAISLRFCDALHRFWYVRGYLSEGLNRCMQTLQKPDTQARTLERAKTLNVAGNLARLQSKFAPASELFEESLTISRQSGDKRGIALSLNGLGGVAYELGDYETARKLFEEDMNVSRQSEDKSAIAQSLNALGLVDRTLINLGLVDSEQSNYDAALARYKESLTLFRELGDKKSIAEVLSGMGDLFRNRSDYDAAIAHYEESLAISRQVKDKQVIAYSLYGLGEIRTKHDLVLAKELYEECLAIRRELGDKKAIAVSLGSLADLCRSRGDYDTARSLYEECLAINRELEYQEGAGWAIRKLGYVELEQGRYREARTRFEDAFAIFQPNHRLGVALSLADLGYVDHGQGDYSIARAQYEKCVPIFRELDDRPCIAMTLNALGLVAYDLGDYVSAKIHHEQGLLLFQTLGDKKGIAESMEAFARLAATEGQAIRAARLWGAAEMLRAETGMPLPPHERPRFERHMIVASEAVGEEKFAIAWTRGRSMSLEQAIEYALAETGD